MSEERIKALEDGQTQLRKDMAQMSANHAQLDKTINALLVKLDSHYEEEKQYEQTIRNIDDNVKDIRIKMASGPMERHREMQALLDPIWELIRKHDGRFSECSVETKNEIKKDNRSHLTLIWTAIIIISGLAVYTYQNDREHCKDSIESIKKDVEFIEKKN